MNTSDSIHPHHLQRRAAIYVRQSSPGQVLKKQESTRLQYALRQRAIERGWHERDLLVIDKDLGITGSTAVDRPGFQELVTLVSLGQIGIVFAYDATRLARNCTDWYQLLDLCGLRQCLVGDQDGIYDPATSNGRLILGLKGLIAELELHTIRARLLAGTIAKAERGELAIPLPAGLVRVKETGAVILEPDREVQARIKLVFQTMREKKSLPKVVRHFRKHDLKVPRRDKWGGTYWKQATLSVISEVVHNPAYAGAYVWGRTRWVKSKKTGRKQQLSLPRDQWRVCLRDRFPAYVSWNVFERIEAMLKDNHAEYQQYQTRGVPREGKALLQGIVYCGECGHKMSLQYKHGAQHLCNFRKMQEAQTLCQRLPGDALDDQVVRWFFEALSVAEIDLSARILAEGDRARDQVLAARRQEVERLHYQARLADRQFQRSDPDNRLVTCHRRTGTPLGRSASCLPRSGGAPPRRRGPCPVPRHSRRPAGTIEGPRSASSRALGTEVVEDVAEKSALANVGRQGRSPADRDRQGARACRMARRCEYDCRGTSTRSELHSTVRLRGNPRNNESTDAGGTIGRADRRRSERQWPSHARAGPVQRPHRRTPPLHPPHDPLPKEITTAPKSWLSDAFSGRR